MLFYFVHKILDGAFSNLHIGKFPVIIYANNYFSTISVGECNQ